MYIDNNIRRITITKDLKEIKIGCNIAKHDLNVKIKQIKKFLEKQIQVKVTLQYKGREITHQDVGKENLLYIQSEIKDLGRANIADKVKGNSLIMSIQPFKKKEVDI